MDEVLQVLSDLPMLVNEAGWSLWTTLYPPEVLAPLVGLLSGALVAQVIHIVQTRRARTLPFLPSYLESVDQEHDAATRYFAAVHDLTMCVTEAWNMKSSRSQDAGSVESNLRRERLATTCERVKSNGQAMMDGLADYQRLSNRIAAAKAQLDASWSYTSRDNYRTETYTESYTDSNGKSRTRTRTRRVYEDTDHWFHYSASEARSARTTLRTLRTERKAAQLVRPDVRRMRVALTNLSQADRMFLEKLYIHTIVEDPEAKPTDDELRSVINQWLIGTRIDEDLKQLEEHMDHGLASSASAFGTIFASRASYHYNTTSRSHSGPPGYQAARRLGSTLGTATAGWMSVSEMWDTCAEAADTLSEWADDSETVESDRDYAKTAIAAYEAAFPDSTLEVDQLTTPGKTALIGLAVAVAVGAAIFALHEQSPLF